MIRKFINQKGHRAAKKLLNNHFITQIDEIDLEGIVYSEGAFIDYKQMNGSEGRIVLNNNTAIISINNRIKHEGKRRFVLAHELGHFMMHRQAKKKYYNCNVKDFLDWNNKRKEETEANQFAAEILMPSQIFYNECVGQKFDFSLISNLAKKFKTSLTSTAIRFVECGHYPCGVIFLQKGMVKWSKFSEDFPLKFIEPNQPIPYNTVARDVFEGDDLPQKPEIVKAMDWFKDDFKIEQYRNWQFYEQCQYFKKYDIIISFLWNY